MSDNRDRGRLVEDQTAESIAGIPVPPHNEDVSPTDGLNEWVEAVMDTIRLDFTADNGATARKGDDRA